MEEKVVYRRGKHCIAPGCTNYYYKTPNKHFHELPLKDDKRLAKWLHNFTRKNAPVNEHALVCSDHFTSEGYVHEGSFDDSGAFVLKKTRYLEKTAVPSVFKFDRIVSVTQTHLPVYCCQHQPEANVLNAWQDVPSNKKGSRLVQTC